MARSPSFHHSSKAKRQHFLLQLASWVWFVTFGSLGLFVLFHDWDSAASDLSRSNAQFVSSEASKASKLSAATPRPKYAYRNIEDIRVGDRVFALNPEISEEERAQRKEPDWSTWRRVQMEMTKLDGGILHIDMIRPKSWFARKMVDPGSSIFLDLPEMGAQGRAKVVATSKCPPIQQGPGQVVTATFAHPPSSRVLDVRFEDEATPIGVTENHPFWSVHRQEFVPIGEMSIGERVAMFHGGTKRIEQKLPRPAPSAVYNLEIYGEHVYFVGVHGFLAHNSCPSLYGDFLPNLQKQGKLYPKRVLPPGKRGVDIGGGKFVNAGSDGVTPDHFLSINPAREHGKFDFPGPTIRVEADVVGYGEHVLATFKSGSIPEIRISRLGYTDINEKMLVESARTLEKGGVFKLTTGAFALTKDPNLVPSWIRTLENHGVRIKSKDFDGGVTLIGVKQ